MGFLSWGGPRDAGPRSSPGEEMLTHRPAGQGGDTASFAKVNPLPDVPGLGASEFRFLSNLTFFYI